MSTTATEIEFKFVTGAEAREIDPQQLPWPDSSAVLYAEQDGEIVGRTASLILPIIEGTWVAESKRGSSLAYRLIKKLEAEACAVGQTQLFAFIMDNQPELHGYMERIGYVKQPLTVWVKALAPTLSEEQLRWMERGKIFHDRLFEAFPNSGHDDDIEHFIMVGKCLEMAFEYDLPLEAISEYNDYINTGVPYDSISFVSIDSDGITVEMGPHGKVLVRQDGSIERL
jgi:Acetyltransferase (GNAT) family